MYVYTIAATQLRHRFGHSFNSIGFHLVSLEFNYYNYIWEWDP